LTLVDHACLTKCLSLLDKLPGEMTFHFNLFPSTIINMTAERLLGELNKARKQRKICVEISEQQFIGDPTYLVEAIRLFKQAGISVAIDDAGFGGSCMESIILLEPDIIKIDKSCIRKIHQDRSRIHSLKRMLGIVLSCHAVPIVEGIETAEELRTLIDLGIQFGQGYYFARPSKELLLQGGLIPAALPDRMSA
jgi:EAL domain-containing protein (putative c-di-GMP-specific phosphodiesterase class I)